MDAVKTTDCGLIHFNKLEKTEILILRILYL